MLADELGIEPGTELQDLHRKILTGERTPDGPKTHALPRDIADFTGRSAMLAELRAEIPVDPARHPPLVMSIDGMAGMGKTTLAVRLAHLVADRYPDAQLYIDLHGHSERAPADPGEALGALLRQVGLPAERVPAGLDERVVLWRSELAGRRVLLVLDNARDSAQIAALLPGSAHSLTLVTSRRRLAALDGVRPFSLDGLSLDESIELLARTVGKRVVAERIAAAELAELCGRLPLALRLAGARLLHRPTWTVGDLAGQLRRTDPAVLDLTIDGRSVAAAFTLSYRALPAEAQRVLRLLSLHPPGVFETRAAASLVDLPVAKAADVLEDLVDAHLVEAPAAGRYRLHDLLRVYAGGLQQAEPAETTEAALTRLLEYYLQTSAAATEHMESARNRGPLRFAEVARARQEFANPVDAQAWLQREFDNVVAAADVAHERGWSRFVCLLPRALWAYMFHGRCDEAFIVLHKRALGAARELGDPALEAMTHNYLGSGYLRRGLPDEAYRELTAAIALRRKIGDRMGTASVLNNLVPLVAHQGRMEEALSFSEQAVAEVQALGNEEMEAKFRGPLGEVQLRFGRHEEALRQGRLRMAYYRRHPDLIQAGLAVSETGRVRLELGQYRVAILLLRRGLAMKRAAGNALGAVETLGLLGRAYRLTGLVEDALACQRAAVDEARQLGSAAVEQATIVDLAMTLVTLGQTGEAIALYREILAVPANQLDWYEEGRAAAGLASVLESRDPASAVRYWRRALEIFARAQVPEQHDAAARLAQLSA